MGIPACTYQIAGVSYTTPNYIILTVSANDDSILQARIINCPLPFNPNTCELSNDHPSVPLSHSVQWEQLPGIPVPNAGPEATLIIRQIGTSDAGSFPPSEYPGQFVLITDQFGNADIVFFSTTFSACSGTCPN
jgi:hypothetical protein